MIANARMYSISPHTALLWRELLSAIIATADIPVEVIDHPAPAPLEALWSRPDQAAVFMCGLPFSRAVPQPTLIAAPVPSPAEYGGEARYWSEWVVRNDSDHRTVADTFGGRIAFTVPESQSGYAAALYFLMSAGGTPPLYRKIIAPTITPLGALSAVIDRDADIAPIDSYAFALMQRYLPELTNQIRVVGRTSPTPIPPLVASRTGFESLQAAFLSAHRLGSVKHLMQPLLLQCFTRPDSSTYTQLQDRFRAATSYWSVHRLAAVTDPAFEICDTST